ncbi:hypothetical protein GCM10023340_27430 [Nocardioides marinquilinus]|uniref:Uncharacterized protein n=1 Tax=Nocardioides marinquilinus TaxID=1210400 RepID=A0ABP9PQ72_9ACTN
MSRPGLAAELGIEAAKNPVRGARPCNRRARKGDATKEQALARAGGHTVADGAANTRRSEVRAEAQSNTAVEISRQAGPVDLSGPNDGAQGPCGPDPVRALLRDRPGSRPPRVLRCVGVRVVCGPDPLDAPWSRGSAVAGLAPRPSWTTPCVHPRLSVGSGRVLV